MPKERKDDEDPPEIDIVGPPENPAYEAALGPRNDAEEQEIFDSAFLHADADLEPWIELILKVGPAHAVGQFEAALEKIAAAPDRGRPPDIKGAAKTVAEYEASGAENPYQFGKIKEGDSHDGREAARKKATRALNKLDDK
jgi:hypothetical protein